MQKGWQTVVLVAAVAAVGWFGLGRGHEEVVRAEPLDTPAIAAMSVQNTITVGASGSVKVDPDVAYLNVAVETRGSTASDAQKTNADKFAAVEKALYDKFAVDRKDVQTTGFYVQPEYNYTEKEGRKLIGYTAVHGIQVKYRKLAEIGKLLDALSAAGANRMDGVQFGTERTDEYERQALQKAMANAESKANVLAASAKREVKRVVNIVQGTSATPPIIMPAAAAKMMDAAAGAPSTSIQSGQIEVTTSVTVQYEMR